MKLYRAKIFLVFGLFSAYFLTACRDYTHGLGVQEVPGLFVGELAFPKEPFDYYKKDAMRYSGYVIYFRNRSFFELNESRVAVTLKNIKIEPGTSWDLMIYFEDSSYSPPFDYGLKYDYIQFRLGAPGVKADGVLNEEHGIYILRIKNFKSED